jgi:hypothetical protein
MSTKQRNKPAAPATKRPKPLRKLIREAFARAGHRDMLWAFARAGHRGGLWVFSASTVADAARYLRAVRSLRRRGVYCLDSYPCRGGMHSLFSFRKPERRTPA